MTELVPAGLALVITCGEQWDPPSAARSRPRGALLSVAYGAAAFALSARLPTAVAVTLLCAAARELAAHAFERRGQGLWTAAGVVAAPYLAAWRSLALLPATARAWRRVPA